MTHPITEAAIRRKMETWARLDLSHLAGLAELTKTTGLSTRRLRERLSRPGIRSARLSLGPVYVIWEALDYLYTPRKPGAPFKNPALQAEAEAVLREQSRDARKTAYTAAVQAGYPQSIRVDRARWAAADLTDLAGIAELVRLTGYKRRRVEDVLKQTHAPRKRQLGNGSVWVTVEALNWLYMPKPLGRVRTRDPAAQAQALDILARDSEEYRMQMIIEALAPPPDEAACG
jgi:predicted DNA-binding transcriptional regulator AlpA